MKRLIAFFLALAMVFALVACGPKETAFTAEKTTATANGVSVDIGTIVQPGEAELAVQQLPEEADAEAGWKIDAYDISIGELHELDDYITIRMPYGEDFCEAGQDPAKCVGAKYKNAETGQWEDVLFEVDAENKNVIVYTDHLSTFGVFYTANEGMRKMYITDVMEDIDFLTADEAAAALQSLGTDEPMTILKAGAAAFGSMTEFAEGYGDLSDYAGNIVNVATLGGEQFDDLLSEEAGDLLKTVGIFASGLKLAKQITSSEASDKLDLYKDTISKLIEMGGETLTTAGGAAFGLAMSGVWIFDKVISKMFEEAKAEKMEEMGAVYTYFNDQFSHGEYKARTLKDWRQILIDIVAAHPNDEAAVQEALNEEIDRYANVFWNLDAGTLGEVEDDAGYKRMPYPSAEEQKSLTEQYKQNLAVRLYPVITSVKNYYANKAKEEYLKSLNKLKDFYNQKVTFTAKEKLEDGQTPSYVGYTWGFGPLAEGVETKDWIGSTVRDSGEMKSVFTLLGYLMAGSPNELRLYAPGDDFNTAEPALVVPFQFTAPAIEVTYGGAPALADLLGDYTGSVTLTSCHISDEAAALYAQQGEVEMTPAECDSYLNELVAKGELSAAQSLSVTANDPSTGLCTLRFTLQSENAVPIYADASYDNGTFTVKSPNGTTPTIQVTEKDGVYTLTGENIVCGVKDVEEYGDMIVFYATLNCEVTK